MFEVFKEYFQKCRKTAPWLMKTWLRCPTNLLFCFSIMQKNLSNWNFYWLKINNKIPNRFTHHLSIHKNWVIVMSHEKGWFGRAEVLKRALSFLFRMEIYILEEIRMDSIRMSWDPPAWIRNLINCSKLKLSVYRFSTQTWSIII